MKATTFIPGVLGVISMILVAICVVRGWLFSLRARRGKAIRYPKNFMTRSVEERSANPLYPEILAIAESEQTINNGTKDYSLSFKTVSSLIDSGYASLLMVDKYNARVLLDTMSALNTNEERLLNDLQLS